MDKTVVAARFTTHLPQGGSGTRHKTSTSRKLSSGTTTSTNLSSGLCSFESSTFEASREVREFEKACRERNTDGWILVVDKNVFDRWQAVRVAEDLSSDTAIATFLIEQYEKSLSEAGQRTAQCENCKTPLGPFCYKCFQLSQPQTDQAVTADTGRETQDLPAGSSTEPSNLGTSFSEENDQNRDLQLGSEHENERVKSPSPFVPATLSIASGGHTYAKKVQAPVESNDTTAANTRSNEMPANTRSDDMPVQGSDSQNKKTELSDHHYAATQRRRHSKQRRSKPVTAIPKTRQGKVKSDHHYALTEQNKAQKRRRWHMKVLNRAKKTYGEGESGTANANIDSDNKSHVKICETNADFDLEKKSQTASLCRSNGNLRTADDTILEEEPLKKHRRKKSTLLCEQRPPRNCAEGAVRIRGSMFSDGAPESNETENKAHKCDICPAAFNRRSNFIAHLKRHGVDQPYKCPQCPDKFSNFRELRTHERDLHASGKTVYVCTLCGAVFKHPFKLNEHMRRHRGEKNHLCDFCGLGFITAAERNIHRRTHTGEKPFPCLVCGKTFARSGCLSVHRRTHANSKDHVCAQCGRGFRHHGHLRDHMKIHTGEKPYQCEVCGKTMAHQSTLVYHMRTHTGEKPYTCPVCGKTFSMSSNMWQHRRTHTKPEPDGSTDTCTDPEQSAQESLSYDHSVIQDQHSGGVSHLNVGLESTMTELNSFYNL